MDWLQLEQRFRHLRPELQYARLDGQTGAAGENWRIAAISQNNSVTEFESLGRIAGQLLKQRVDEKSPHYKQLDHHDPLIVWYRAMKTFSERYELNSPVFQQDDKGEFTQVIHTGRIYDISAVAGNVCLMMQSIYPLRESWFKRLYDNHGKQILNAALTALVIAFGGWVISVL